MKLLEVMDALVAVVKRPLEEDELAILTRVVRNEQSAPEERRRSLEDVRDGLLEAYGLREQIPDRELDTERYYVTDRDVRKVEPE